MKRNELTGARQVSHPFIAAIAGFVFIFAILGLYHGGGSDKKASSTNTTSTSLRRVLDPDFGTIAFTVKDSAGKASDKCGLLASTNAQLAKGLMGKDNLEGYDAMVFQFTSDVKSSFYMANVKFPLTVAWFDSTGKFVSSTDMPLCNLTSDKCPRYPADGAYRFALEVQKGGLSGLGISPSSTVSLGSACS